MKWRPARLFIHERSAHLIFVVLHISHASHNSHSALRTLQSALERPGESISCQAWDHKSRSVHPILGHQLVALGKRGSRRWLANADQQNRLPPVGSMLWFGY